VKEPVPILNYYEQCASTNDLAREKAAIGVPEGNIYWTDCQTQGRGRRGRAWLSDFPGSLAMSILVRPDMPAVRNNFLSIIAALLLRNTLDKLIMCHLRNKKTLKHPIPKIKWPNDIIINNKKASGILIENSYSGDLMSYGVVGFGINLNNTDFPAEIREYAISLKSITGIDYDMKKSATIISQDFLRLYYKWKTAEDIQNFSKGILDEYRKHSVTINSDITVLDESATSSYEAFAEDIDNQGGLTVRLKDGSKKSIYSGDVSIRKIGKYV